MNKDAYYYKGGFSQLFRAPCRTFSICTVLVVSLTFIVGSSSATAQSKTTTTAPAARSVKGSKPVQPKKQPRQQTALSQTRSIIQPANHEELIIPNALELDGGASHEVIYDNDPSFACGPDNAYDFVTDRRSQGSKHYFVDWSRADLWMGASGFTNPASALINGSNTAAHLEGSFGFQEGFNFGSQLPSLLSGQVGSQLGMRLVQSNLDGSSVSDNSRNQLFATAGLFRRIDYGFQGGVVIDYLRDQWIYKADLWQLRGELSFLFSPAHEIGFRFSDGGKTHRQNVRLSSGTNLNVEVQPLDTYRIFGRVRFGPRAANTAELQVGSSKNGGLLLGCLLQTPLSGQVGLETAATYFMPKGSVATAETREAWNLSMAFVWTPGRMFGTHRDYNRPLFEVASNNSFIASRP